MTTRLERLLNILENGSNSYVKQQAAIQIAQFFEENKCDLFRILHQIMPYFTSRHWDTRIATSVTLAKILEMLSDCHFIGPVMRNVQFPNSFDVNVILDEHSLLLAANDTQTNSQDQQDVSKQNELLNSVIGIKEVKSTFIDGLIQKTDLVVHEEVSPANSRKRKAQLHIMSPIAKINKCNYIEKDFDKNDSTAEWPFINFCQEMLEKLSDPLWTVRHGAAKALFVCLNNCTFRNISGILPFLRHCCICFLNVMVLDRFTDFTGDRSHAPIRELCSNCIACLARVFELKDLENLLILIINQFLQNKINWQIRVAGYLMLKHLFTRDHFEKVSLQLMIRVRDYLITAFDDADEDIRCESCEAFMNLINLDSRILLESADKNLLHQVWSPISRRIQSSNLDTTFVSQIKLLSSLLKSCKDISTIEDDIVDKIWLLYPDHQELSRIEIVECVSVINNINFIFNLTVVAINDSSLKVVEVAVKALNKLFIKDNIDCSLKNDFLNFLISAVRTPNGYHVESNMSSSALLSAKIYLGGTQVLSLSGCELEHVVQTRRLILLNLLTNAIDFWSFDPNSLLLSLLESSSAESKIIGFIILCYLRKAESAFSTLIMQSVEKICHFEELSQSFVKIHAVCKQLIKFISYKKDIKVFGIEEAKELLELEIEKVCEESMQLKSSLEVILENYTSAHFIYSYRVRALAAASFILCDFEPNKLTPIIRSLLDSLKNEIIMEYITFTTDALKKLLAKMKLSFHKSYNKVISNIKQLLISKDLFNLNSILLEESPGEASKNDELCNVISLIKLPPTYSQIRNSVMHPLIEILTSDSNVINELIFGTEYDFEDVEILRSTLLLADILLPFTTSFEQNFNNVMNRFLLLLNHTVRDIRHFAARVLSNATYHWMNEILSAILNELVICDYTSNAAIGLLESLYLILERRSFAVADYSKEIMASMITLMNHNNVLIRRLSSYCCAHLFSFINLATSKPPETFLNGLHSNIADTKLLNYFCGDYKSIPHLEKSAFCNVELRTYQQEGLNWLGFLNNLGLNGILADDLGLGKTVMTLCMLAIDFTNCLKSQAPSLIVCPTTLIYHWAAEFQKCINSNEFFCLVYNSKLNLKEISNSLVVISYDKLRSDNESLLAVNWNYVVLDEGHVIKNSKTKLFKAVSDLCCRHKLILTGTPIQNSVTELWSLFEFLMPGYLGSHKLFQSQFANPITNSKDSKASQRAIESGQKALQQLHKRTLPFILRRLKEDVLEDLPPKILQDFYCEMTSEQAALYERVLGDNEENKQEVHFRKLKKLKTVCNHPYLIDKSFPSNYAASGKFIALKQILEMIGLHNTNDPSITSRHRVLIFFQTKIVLKCVEDFLLKMEFPHLTYSCIDGSLNAAERFSIVQKFNLDPSIDLLMLTTKVGGMGLNLTAADTIVFFEHDYNPMNDLQAMDRAHRIGQKRTVNVYRILTSDSIEEHIMNLQKFKISVARAVVNEENASSELMETQSAMDSRIQALPGKSTFGDDSYKSLLIDAMSADLNENDEF